MLKMLQIETSRGRVGPDRRNENPVGRNAMITVALTNDQFAMLHRLVREGREQESTRAYGSQWPANSHHEANVRLIDSVDDAMRAAVDAAVRVNNVMAR